MSRPTLHPEALADQRADRFTMMIGVAFILASLVVDGFSDQFDMQRSGRAASFEPWILTTSSHLTVIALLPLWPLVLNRAPLRPGVLKQSIPVHIGASLIYCLLHVSVMVTLRKLAFPLLLDEGYDFGLRRPSIWFYEYRKDILDYSLIAPIFTVNRMLEQRSLEAKAVREEARAGGRLTLKCGGTTLFVDAADVIAAHAASNYVEVETAHKTHLARMTLKELEDLLGEIGSPHIRVHRSHIVHSGHIAEISPTGDGNVSIRLDTGATVTGSRSYRDRLPA